MLQCVCGRENRLGLAVFFWSVLVGFAPWGPWGLLTPPPVLGAELFGDVIPAVGDTWPHPPLWH